MKPFINKGPETGLVEPNLIMASRDRVAMDAVGVALLRHYSTTRKVSSGRIFDLEQIKMASKLGFGVKNMEDIEIYLSQFWG